MSLVQRFFSTIMEYNIDLYLKFGITLLFDFRSLIVQVIPLFEV